MTTTEATADTSTDRARRLHREATVIDSLGGPGPVVYTPTALAAIAAAAEQNLPWAMVYRAMSDAILTEWRHAGPPQEYWDDWAACGVTASSFTLGAFGERPFTYANAIQDLAEFTGRIDRCDQLVKVLRADDIRQCKRDGRFGLIFNFQNTDHLDGRLDNLDLFYDFGLRVIQLTYNSRNLVGEGCTERTQGGLSHFGLDVVARMNELGILVDVSHCGEGTTLDAIQHSTKPVAITHSMARAVHDHPRGKTDHVIKEIAQANGYFGVLLLPCFLAPAGGASLDMWLRHLEHVINLAGIEHVGIGTDNPGDLPAELVASANKAFRPDGGMGMRDDTVDFGVGIEGFDNWAYGWPRLTETLVRAGYDDAEIVGLLGANFLRVFEAAVG